MKRLMIALFVCSCATAPQPVNSPAKVQKQEPVNPPTPESVEALEQLWPQEKNLLGTGSACPFSHQRKEGEAPSLTVSYVREPVHTGPYAVRLQYSGAAETSAGWGIGCLAYDAGLFSYLRFYVQGQPGTRYQLRLRDRRGQDGTAVDLAVKGSGWQRVVLPLRDFRGIDMRGLQSIAFSFHDRLGAADIYVDDLEFLTQPDVD